MRRIVSKKISQWLLPVMLILFILEVLLLPVVLEITYAGRGDGPDHILTYTTNSLMWDSATGIDEYGVAVLDLFDSLYDGTVDGGGDKVVAPGTQGSSTVRLKNDCDRTITYTAVLYRIRTTEALPVEAALAGEGLTDTDSYQLPYQVEPEHVVRAVSGELKADRILDFDISWLWEFEQSGEQNAIDTGLGNAVQADEVTVGLYIVVEDEGEQRDPSIPPTGDESRLAMYLTLMGISFCALILLLWDYRRREREAA